MKTTVKCIIKYALICEIITAIIGEIGEFILRINEYINFFRHLESDYFESILLSICLTFVIINIIFIIAIINELLPIIIFITILWIIQLIFSLTLMSKVIIPSVFTILVISIVLIFDLIFIAFLSEERQELNQKQSQMMSIKLINANDLDEL
jgi:hypothetical protein